MHGRKAAPAEIAATGVGHRKGISHSYGGIDGIAALPQHLNSNVGCQVLRAYNHAIHGGDWLAGDTPGRQGRRKKTSSNDTYL
jgi:hypothetical protein